MKKWLTLIIILLISVVLTFSCAETETPEKAEGVWYVYSVTIDNKTYDVSKTSNRMDFVFEDDHTGYWYYLLEGRKNYFNWTKDNNKYLLTASGADDHADRMEAVFQDDNLAISGEERQYVLSRTMPGSVGIINGLYVEYTYSVPERSGESKAKLINTAMHMIRMRFIHKGILFPRVRKNDDELISVAFPDVTDDTILDLISAKGQLEFRDENGEIVITGDMIKNAYSHSEDGEQQLVLWLTDEGKKILADFTSANMGKTMTILMDGAELCSPVINAPITDGSVVISNMGSEERVTSIATKILFSPMPVELTQQWVERVLDVHGAEKLAAEKREKTEDGKTVILKLGDKEITKAEVLEKVQDELDYMAYWYAEYGYSFDTSDPDHIAEAQKTVLDDFRKELVLPVKAEELGLNILTEEEMNTVQANAGSKYDLALDYVKESILEDTENKDAETMTREATSWLEKQGYPLEYYIEAETKQMINDKLRAYIIRDVSVSDEEIQAEHDRRAADGADESELSEEAIREALLTAKQEETYNAMVESWISNSDLKENLEALTK